MKHKSKKQKIKSGTGSPERVPAQWLYLLPSKTDIRRIKDALGDFPGTDIEIWEEAGVLEITLSDKTTIDLEETACDLGDEESNRFLKDQNAETLLYVTITPASYALAEPVMKAAVRKLGGLFCGDTNDFQPQIRAQ